MNPKYCEDYLCISLHPKAFPLLVLGHMAVCIQLAFNPFLEKEYLCKKQKKKEKVYFTIKILKIINSSAPHMDGFSEHSWK